MFESLEMPVLWAGFLVFIGAMVAIDLGVFHRTTREVTFREAVAWTLVWMACSAVFAGLLYFLPGFGARATGEYLTGYLLELALSVDNMFVFVVIFSTFAVPKAYEHRVLFWGIVGAVVLRGLFIGLGAAIIARFHWVLYIFGVILLWTGGRLLFAGGEDEEADIEQSGAVKLVRRVLGNRMTDTYRKDRFFVLENGRRLATPLLLVLCVIELSDVVFALDSIPAIFAVTTNPFIVFTSNMFAILGLRSIYFVLSVLLPMFRFLKTGVALVLLFIAVKILSMDLIHLIGWDHFPTSISLTVVATLLIGSIVLSKLIPAKPKKEHESKSDGEARASE
ncbi:TerC family protein [Sandaracinus amylolyticus]|uniref:TerC family protein n=1 Tax=Sandaracinus amylolyticus TaxID=927083 RepID=UPI001F17908A|nr:TerC family protein [Sandaracinus amylolyticus]UJR80854.1 Integral membrane protein TerC, tellurite resistance protein TerC [Sandaracinus amylolyticus]